MSTIVTVTPVPGPFGCLGAGPGQAIGATDAVGLRAVEDRIHVHDIHATILHLLGLDHTRLTYRHNGRDERLTDVAGNVIEKALA